MLIHRFFRPFSTQQTSNSLRLLEYIKTLHKFPSPALLTQFQSEMHLNPAQKITPTEREALRARKWWTEAVSNINKQNEVFKKTYDIQQTVKNRLENLGYKENLDLLFLKIITVLQKNSTLVVSFNAHNFSQFTDFQLLNMFQRFTNASPEYSTLRQATERVLFKILDPALSIQLDCNRPRYGALYLHQEDEDGNLVRGIEYYGKSFATLSFAAKLNTVYNACDSVFAFHDNINLTPCSFHHFDVLLMDAQDKLLDALAKAALTGKLLLSDYNQQLVECPQDGGYIEAMLPQIDFLNPHLVSKIFINPEEHQLTPDEEALFSFLNIPIENGNKAPYSSIPSP